MEIIFRENLYEKDKIFYKISKAGFFLFLL